MKLEKKYLFKCYHDAMIMQYREELESQGFKVVEEMPINIYEMKRITVDLFAERDGIKRVYEFKLIGSNKYQKGKISQFKEIARAIGAKPFVIYVNPPTEKDIVFDDLGKILEYYFINGSVPSELDSLSTHTAIEEVYISEIASVKIEPCEIELSGNAIVSVTLHYGSESDQRHGNGAELSTDFPMEFSVCLNEELKITDIHYDIDTSEWYEA